jgi:predicted transcriptional regulator of viral defense system
VREPVSNRNPGALLNMPSCGADAPMPIAPSFLAASRRGGRLEMSVLERVARGRYRLPNTPVTEHHGLALVAATAPKAVICLLSALSFHQIGTQLPHEVWIALDRRV